MLIHMHCTTIIITTATMATSAQVDSIATVKHRMLLKSAVKDSTKNTITMCGDTIIINAIKED